MDELDLLGALGHRSHCRSAVVGIEVVDDEQTLAPARESRRSGSDFALFQTCALCGMDAYRIVW